MREMLIVYLPYAISVIGSYQIWTAGDKKWYTWLIAMGNQVLWSTWIVISANWGLLPFNIVCWILYVRNHLRWRAES